MAVLDTPYTGDFVPGTVHLVDLQGTMHAQHAGGKKNDIVLIPAPSNDPDDPLNWSPGRKFVFLSCLCVYISTIGIASAAIYSVLVPISTASGLTVNTLVEGTGYMFLVLGWGCLICQPLALQYGKRPMYLLSLLGTMGMMIWAPYCKTQGQWIASKCIQGFFSAVIESLCEISISDVYFTHERGTYVGIYALFLAGSNFFAPIISGFINDGQGWEWVLHWCAIFLGVAFLICFFFMEETNYVRQPITSIEPDQSENQATPTGIVEANNNAEKTNTTEIAAESEVGAVHSKMTFVKRLALFRREDLKKKNQLVGMMIRPLIFFTFPVIAFAGFMYGAIICYFNVLNGTASLILSSPPYNFPASMVGLSYLACLIGVFLGAYFSGPFGDKFILWKARRNNGIMEPEHRLWLYCSLLVLIPGGLLLWGLGAAHGVHWFGLVFAMGMLGASITIGCQLPISYCIDSYKDISGDAIVTVILIRNTMSFAVSYGITPWITNMGYQNAFLVAAFVAMAQAATFFIFILYGKRLRKHSVRRYWKYVEQIQASGLAH